MAVAAFKSVIRLFALRRPSSPRLHKRFCVWWLVNGEQVLSASPRKLQPFLESTRMSRLRLLFFWLLVLAIPLQGFAATTKLLCGSAGMTSHQHAEADSVGSEHSHLHHGRGEGPYHSQVVDSSASLSAALDAPAHQCGLCAACCHAVALSSAYQAEFALPPQLADAPEVHARIPDRDLRQPDKPPRT